MIEKLTTVYESLADIAQLIVNAGWGESTAGNISVNVTSLLEPETIAGTGSGFRELPNSYPLLSKQILLVSISGSRMRDLSKDPSAALCLIMIDTKGQSYDIADKAGSGLKEIKPTSELPSHLAVHKVLMEQGGHKKVLLHTHMTEAIVITHNPLYKNQDDLNRALWALQPEMPMFMPEGVGVVNYVSPGSNEIGTATAEKFRHHNTVIWEKHGCLSAGASPNEAFDNMEMTAKTIRILLECLNAGFVPEGLSPQAIKALRKQ